MEFSHVPVLLNECLEGLAIDPAGTYLDGTAGGGGHSSEIARRLTTGRLISLDQDPDAVAVATERLKGLPALFGSSHKKFFGALHHLELYGDAFNFHDFYNQRYFQGKLKQVQFNLVNNPNLFGLTACYGNQPACISISPQCFNSTECFDETFVHELCHQADFQFSKSVSTVETKHLEQNGHGASWQAWMERCGRTPTVEALYTSSINRGVLEFAGQIARQEASPVLAYHLKDTPTPVRFVYSIYGRKSYSLENLMYM